MLGSHDHTVISVRVSWLGSAGRGARRHNAGAADSDQRFTSFSLTPAPLILCCDVLIRNTFECTSG